MDSICKECQLGFRSLEAMHRHLRAHKISLAYYYQKHFPRYDKYDGSLIVFKSIEYYFSTDFNNRRNVSAWFKSNDKNTVKHYLTDWLFNRIARKQLKFMPTQVELRTLPVPGMKYWQEVWGIPYTQIAAEFGLMSRFSLRSFSGSWDTFNSGSKIIIDTREQLPLKFKGIKTISEGLPFGDYKLDNDSMSKHGFIERKAVGDLYGTMTGGYERFQKELDKANEACAYIVVVVEGDFETVKDYPNHTGGRVKISPEFIFHRVRELIQKYDHIQFLFTKNRDDSTEAIKKIFTSKGQYKQIDLQYQYDTGGLI